MLTVKGQPYTRESVRSEIEQNPKMHWKYMIEGSISESVKRGHNYVYCVVPSPGLPVPPNRTSILQIEHTQILKIKDR